MGLDEKAIKQRITEMIQAGKTNDEIGTELDLHGWEARQVIYSIRTKLKGKPETPTPKKKPGRKPGIASVPMTPHSIQLVERPSSGQVAVVFGSIENVGKLLRDMQGVAP